MGPVPSLKGSDGSGQAREAQTLLGNKEDNCREPHDTGLPCSTESNFNPQLWLWKCLTPALSSAPRPLDDGVPRAQSLDLFHPPSQRDLTSL